MNDIEVRINEYENKIKSILKPAFKQIIEDNSKNIKQINETLNNLQIDPVNLSNVGIRLNNSFNRLNLEFEKKSLSFLAVYNKKIDCVTPSVVGEAILDDLLESTNESIVLLGKYNLILERIFYRKKEGYDKLLNATFVDKMVFKKKLKEDYKIIKELREEEKEDLHNMYRKHEDLNDRIYNYSIENDLMDSLKIFFEAGLNDCAKNESRLNSEKDEVIRTLKLLQLEYKVHEFLNMVNPILEKKGRIK